MKGASEDKRNHGLSVLWVLVSKGLLVLCVFLLSPHHHGSCSSDKEDVGRPVIGHDGKHGPGEKLEKVIWKGDKLEGETVRDLVCPGAVRSQSSQDDVAVQVTDLKDNHGSPEPLQFVQGAVLHMVDDAPELVAVGNVLRGVDGEGDEQAVDPVVARVSEEKCEGHGVCRKGVDE